MLGPKPRRRWQAGSIGELWQHDSSPHDWWPAPTKPILILTLDDHSRRIVAGSFVASETTWAHFSAARAAITTHGTPRAYYTDFEPANALLAEQIAWHNAHRATGLVPDHAWQLALDEKRSKLAPAALPTLCDLHLAIHFQRGSSNDHSIEVFARRWPIAPTRLKSVTIVLHPERRFGSSLILLWLPPSPGLPSSLITPSDPCPVLLSARQYMRTGLP